MEDFVIQLAGFAKVNGTNETDRIIGATIVARYTGDVISETTLAMTCGLDLSKIDITIPLYLTEAESIRNLGDQYCRTRLTPFVKALLNSWQGGLAADEFRRPAILKESACLWANEQHKRTARQSGSLITKILYSNMERA